MEYEALFNELFDRHLKELADYATSGEKGAYRFVLGQRTRILGQMIPRKAEIKAEFVQVVIEPEWDSRISNRRKFVESTQQDVDSKDAEA